MTVSASKAAQQSDESVSQDGDVLTYKRATYYVRPEQIKALKLRAVNEERNISALVRDALDRYLLDKSPVSQGGGNRPSSDTGQARAIRSQSHGKDYLFCD